MCIRDRPYTMKDSAPKIRCRMLVVDSEGDKDMPGQARQLLSLIHISEPTRPY